MGLKFSTNLLLGIAFSVLLAGALAAPSMTRAAYATSSNLTVNAYSLSGQPLSMWTTIWQNGSMVKSGYTPLVFAAAEGSAYTVRGYNFAADGIFFDHWQDGSTSRTTTVTVRGDTWVNSFHRTADGLHSLTVNAYTTDSAALHMYATVKSGGSTIKSGYTPFTIAGKADATYTVTVEGYGTYDFDHWGNWDGHSNPRTLVLYGDTTATAYYKAASSTTTQALTPAPAPAPVQSPTPSSPPPAAPAPEGIQGILPKTGVFVALYRYPSSSGASSWQQVYDEKVKHPSVPLVAVFNPASGPGWSDDGTISNWVNKLKSVGIIMLGYTHDDYGSRSLSSLNADADKYMNWYNADGLFIDEFTNKVGYESHYSQMTAHAKSIGMKMTMGNPGTDVPRSYIGSVDVINITEGSGYMPLSWLQFCVLCGDSGWHHEVDKRNFAYTRYGLSWLDTSFEINSSQWVGLLYITDGDDSNSRWFYLPPYFDTLVATLDR
jgi:hypothetical protein